MSLSDVLAIIGIVIGVIGVAAAFFAARRWGNRRMRLGIDIRSTPLLPLGTLGGDTLLKITYRDYEVPDPHLVTITLRNVGPGDISTTRFDSGSPLNVNLNCTMYGITATSNPSATLSTAVGSPAQVSLRPVLLKRGEVVLIEAVVSGSATPQIENPLIDTDVVPMPEPRTQAVVSALGDVFIQAVVRELSRFG